MFDTNMIIANNISSILKKTGKKQTDLAKELGYSKQVVSNMLSGSRSISAIELSKIASCFHVSVDSLLKLPKIPMEMNTVKAFMGQVESENAREGIEFADEIIDLYLFHTRVYERGMKGMKEKSSL